MLAGDLFAHAMLKAQEASIKLHRRHDQPTSIEAAEAIAPKLNEIQQQVLSYAKDMKYGFTDVDLNKFFESTSSTYRTRRAELVAQGLLADSWQREKINGRKHIVWILKDYL
jgi:hypothetical protein